MHLTENYASYRADFERQGFVVIRQFLPAEELRELEDQLARYLRDVVPTLPATAAFYHQRDRKETLKQLQHMQCDPYFAEYCHRPRWKSLAESLLGEPASCESPEWFNKPPGLDHPTPPHQDNFYFNLKPPRVVSIWLALDVVDDANGCLRYLPKSHMQGMRPHARSNILGFSQGITDFGPADIEVEERVHLQPADAVAHHGMTVHRAEPNQSTTRHRRAFAMVFRGSSCRRDEEAYSRYLAALQSQHETLQKDASP